MTARHQRLESVLQLGTVALGRLRARLLGLRGAHLGRKSTLGARVAVQRPWGLRTGERFVAEADVYLKLVADDARLEIGDATFIGRGTEFDVAESVTIGSHTVIAPGCFITDHNHGMSPALRIDQQPAVTAPVVIGSDVWIGTRVVVLAGVRIGHGAVVAAGAVVTRDVDAMSVVAGVPARLVRVRS